MVAWCQNTGKQPTRGRLLNWLSREDKPFNLSSKPPKKPDVGIALPVQTVLTDEAAEFLDEYIADLLLKDDLVQLENERDRISAQGGARLPCEFRVVEYFKQQPTTEVL